MAECHPVGFRFVMKARERGAKIIHVDPRYSRTSAAADLYVPIRAGSDIALLGGLINYVLEHDLWFKEYVVNYTNAPEIISEDFADTEDLAGVFSGLDPENRRYRVATWQYTNEELDPATMADEFSSGQPFRGQMGRASGWPPPSDPTLQHPRCVFQILKRHFSRYTPEMVERACGIPRELFFQVARTITENSGRERTTAFCYAVGWTQHSTGVQMIRAAAILQLLLGNIGRPGGGIMALRGHATIQGSTDVPTLYDLLPGYLPMPDLRKGHFSYEHYVARNQAQTGWWHNFPKYAVSLLKAWFGEQATAENGWCFDYLPKIDRDISFQPYVMDMMDGKVKGYFVMGQNPLVGGPNAGFERKAFAKLDWLVVRDSAMIETATFWKSAPEVERGELDPKQIKTEVFFLPAALCAEKEGSFTNTQRLLQWHDKAVEPPGDARSELWFMYHLGLRLKELYKDSTLERDKPIQALTWDYGFVGKHGEPDPIRVLKEINGFTVADGKPVTGFRALQDDGTTACGCWIYSGVYPEEGKNLARSRQADEYTSLNWGFAWPANRRILYNRASADPQGRPWSERKKYIWWDAEQKRWTGYDTPDFAATKPPDYQPSEGAKGDDALPGTAPFIMMVNGRGALYVPLGLRDGPLPTHYEPLETVIKNPLYEQQSSPVLKYRPYVGNELASFGDPRYPYIGVTFRVTEHHTTGGMSRWNSWLAELQPEMWVEISPELAAEKGIENRDFVTIRSPRGVIQARALVTSRIRPLRLDGKVVHQIGLPWHFGYEGLITGAVANDLVAILAEPNISIPEYKVFLCNIEPAGVSSSGGER